MTSSSADALFQLSSGNLVALRTVYEEHAAAMWGMALLVTRSRRRAHGVLERLLCELSQSPERFADGRDLRVCVLAAALRLSTVAGRHKRRPWLGLSKRSRAVRGPGAAALAAKLDAASEEDAVRLALLEIEGLSPERLAEPGKHADAPAASTERPVRWTEPPRSLRSLVLMKATEAARPERKYVRWFLMWLAPLAGLVLATLSERAAPRLPVEKMRQPPVSGGFEERTPEERQRWIEFLRGEPPK